jgi:anhydro-N-acetylmuramic acid kinase
VTKLFTALGLMSGTSMDGIDVALVRTDGEAALERGPFLSVPYSPEMRAELAGALAEAQSIRRHTERPGSLAETEARLTRLHADAVSAFLVSTGLNIGDIDVVGFHGQTVLHRPERGLTVQIGDGAALARATGIPVVTDLRQADAQSGGQGAPLAPVYHRALASSLAERPVAFVNIGGVANVTFVGADGGLVAFDCGPGNAMLDDWALRHTGRPVDLDGALSAKGRVHEATLAAFLATPFFAVAPPKSLDRNDFTLDRLPPLSPEDGAATLAALTVEGIARAEALMPAAVNRWVVCGGGRRNRHLMALLKARLGTVVSSAEDAGFDGDAVEAEAWAYLAVRSLRGLPLTFPGTTSCPRPLPGGVLHRPF